jgi:hypothetical protein
MRTIFCATWRGVCLGAAASLLSACAASQPAINPAMSTQDARVRPARGASGDLLYAGGNHTVQVLTYPGGVAKGSGKTPGAVNGICSDASGNVYVAEAPKKDSAAGTGYVAEYSHGGTSPIASLTVPKGQVPMDCGSDASSGNLAVTLQDSKNYAPSVAVYAGASGTPTVYRSKALGAAPQCGYDANGDLFVSSGGNVLAELAAGQSSMITITLNQILGGTKHLQWDGTYVAIQSFRTKRHNGERLDASVFRVAVSGSSGKVAGISEFKKWPVKVSGSSWIDGDTIVGTPSSEIAFWKYPEGGAPAKVVHLSSHMSAVTISSGP